jgi:hypothetical protein
MDPWRDAFAIRLRMNDISGPAIGDALADVDTHCTDTGENPADAFGDPLRYADAISASLPASARVPRTPWWRTALLATGTMLGVQFLFSGISAITHGGPGTISWGNLVSLVLVVGLIGMIITMLSRLTVPEPPLRLFVVLAVVLAVAVAAAMTPPVIWPQTAFTAPGWALLGGAALSLATWVPLPWRRHAPDLIVDPRTGREPFG